MSWETLENPRGIQFLPVPRDGVRVSCQQGNKGRRRIVIVIGADLARGIGWTKTFENCRLMLGKGGTEEGKVAVVNDPGGAFKATRRAGSGSYEVRVGQAAASTNFSLDFAKFERLHLEAIRPRNGQPPFFAFLAGDMLQTAELRSVA